MENLQIIIKRTNDKTPAWPELNEENSNLGSIRGACILEKGTTQGKASIALRIETKNGVVVAQITENLFTALNSALMGAKMNWVENPLP